MKVLVAYASRHGATRGIAEHVATRLEKAGLDVTLRPVDQAEPIDGYDAFVVGSAAYLGGWLGEATAFVRRHRDVLVEHSVWLFSSGPTGTEKLDSKGRDLLNTSKPKEFAEFARSIRPRDERVFFGAYHADAEPSGMAEGLMARFLRMVPAARQALPEGDFRDWLAIDAWAEQIGRDLRPVDARTGGGPQT